MERRPYSFSNKKSKQQNESKTKWTHLTIYFKRSYEGDIQQIKPKIYGRVQYYLYKTGERLSKGL